MRDRQRQGKERERNFHLPDRSVWIIFLLLYPSFDGLGRMPMLKRRGGRGRSHLLLLRLLMRLLMLLLLLLLPRLRSSKVSIVHGVTGVLRREGRVLRVNLMILLLRGLSAPMVVGRWRVGLVAKALAFVVPGHGSRR